MRQKLVRKVTESKQEKMKNNQLLIEVCIYWVGHGWGMGGAWARHGWGMGETWVRHGWGMGGAWVGHGCGMEPACLCVWVGIVCVCYVHL